MAICKRKENYKRQSNSTRNRRESNQTNLSQGTYDNVRHIDNTKSKLEWTSWKNEIKGPRISYKINEYYTNSASSLHIFQHLFKTKYVL